MVYDSKPWLKSYDPGVGAEIEIPNITVKDLYEEAGERFADRAAFHYLGTTMTFGELMEKSARFARGLSERGLGAGDVVAINLPNTPQYIIAVVGAIRAGCAISGVAPLLTGEEMVYQLNDSGAKALITLDLLFDQRFSAVAHLVKNLELVLVAGVFDCLPGVTQFPAGKPLEGKEVMSFMDFLKSYPDDLPIVKVSPADHCFLQYTGGTTGVPKGAILTHYNLVANMTQQDYWVKDEHGTGCTVSGFPMFHQAGLFVATSCLAWGITQCLIPDPRNLDHIIQETAQHHPTTLVHVPSLYLMLLAKPEFQQLDFSSLKSCMSGAAPFPIEGAKALENVVGAGKMLEVWGMTETSPLITVNPYLGRKKIGSVGLPLPSTQFRIVDLVDGWTQVPIGQEGELITCGPQVMKGYHNKPAETAIALREHDGRVWMHTGDIGRMDEDGFVYVVDRLKDMISVGGFKVFSSEVEDKLYKHPAIGFCALIGVPNPERPETEIVKLVVQKSEAYKDKPDDEVRGELLEFSREKLAAYKVPKIVEFTTAMPLTAVGKVNKKALRK